MMRIVRYAAPQITTIRDALIARAMMLDANGHEISASATWRAVELLTRAIDAIRTRAST